MPPGGERFKVRTFESNAPTPPPKKNFNLNGFKIYETKLPPHYNMWDGTGEVQTPQRIMKRWILGSKGPFHKHNKNQNILFIFNFFLFLLFLLPKIQIQVDAILQMTCYK